MVLRGNQMGRTYRAMGMLAAVLAILSADGKLRADTRSSGDDVFVPAAPTLAVAPHAPDLSVLDEALPAIHVPDLEPERRF